MQTGSRHFTHRHAVRTAVWVALLFGSGSFPVISSGQHSYAVISEELRQKWIEDAVAFLQQVNHQEFVNEIEFYESNRGENAALACRVYETGILRLGDQGWICFVTHSLHQNQQVGDIVLAVDQDRNIYEIDSHVCGGTAFFMGQDMTTPTNSAQFFAWFNSDKHNSKWQLREPQVSDISRQD